MIELFAGVLSLTFLIQVLRIAVPYAMAALGGAVAERSGVINIALEGKLLIGAFVATLVAHQSGSVVLAALCGSLAGLCVGALYAFIVVRFGADQIVVGVAINMMAYGLTRYLLKIFFDSTASSPRTVGLDGRVLSTPLFWICCTLVVAVHVLVSRTRYGLRLRAVGEHPDAAHALGVSVARVRFWAVLIAGALAGLGGAWLSLRSHGFAAEMSGGRGYIALAAVIMGRWRPQWAVVACLAFALAEALQVNLQAAGLGVPVELLVAVPYLLTMVTLAGFIGRARAPAALGKHYRAE